MTFAFLSLINNQEILWNLSLLFSELFYTEKSHLRDIKVMQLFFYWPMSQEPSLVELADLVFPRINEIVEFHSWLLCTVLFKNNLLRVIWEFGLLRYV